MDNQSIMSQGFEEKENHHQHPNFHLVDAGRTDGLKNTSLNVLNSKKSHKTQIQKQFQQFNQQRQSVRPPPHQQTYHQGPYQQYNQPQQQQTQYGNGPYAQQQYFNSMPPPSIRGVPPPGARSNQSLNSIASSNYGSSNHIPSMLPQGEWYSSSARVSPNKSPSLRLSSLSSNTQFQPIQSDFKNTSPVLSQSGWETPFHEEKLKELEDANEKLSRENEELRRMNEAKYRVVNQENDQLQSNLDSVQLELHKLKLEHNSVKETHKMELKKLREKNCKLENDLDNLTNLAEKSNETTPNGSPRTTISKNSDLDSSSSPNLMQSLPETSKTLQQAQSNIENNDLIQDLMETIKYLKADNNILLNQYEQLTNQVIKDKKLINRLSNVSRYQTKIRKGFNILENVDTFI
ncbi:hypothetical protein BN7_971 [Wickerhamomyces ciferrii]|uniref:Uncharacterized protein n=1 Tax=Wickerhamomyces ciferrii (strain ATCC 14091 / BCRC 22168 / CBS 111 / JCM 3599 / NBRC 0793 / NRRL Y-1031 F-60-10) TaxID=1206466 RepID=K0K961_WICCF|nr:uncharacterized protein BN7_971 [Wickerhamomyces ciferrii]CCH41430.1 hypothetical protein BN7_971 [Wickerhamomyces ciferrii]